MKVYKTLADLDFGKILFEASVQTQTGKEIINKYQAQVMTSAVTCSTINNFLREAKMHLYDSGLNRVYEALANVINDNKYSWSLATICESIFADNNSKNFLVRRAAEEVQPLLEMSEADVVAYIKSGALKNVMHVEAFRNIAKAVYKDQPIVEQYVDFTLVHPISMVEESEGVKYFEVLGSLYKLEGEQISEATSKEVTNEFLVVSRLLESDICSFNPRNEVLTIKVRNMQYEVSEQGQAIRIDANGQRTLLTCEQLREQNQIYLSTVPYTMRGGVAQVLESVVKLAESFDSICVMDNVNLISTNTDRFLLIEEGGNAFAKSIYSSRVTPWNVNDNIAEAVKIIKKNTKVDLTEAFKEKIEQIVEKVAEEEGEQIKESLKENELNSRREKIRELTERYKNDPVRLQVLSQIVSDLNDCE